MKNEKIFEWLKLSSDNFTTGLTIQQLLDLKTILEKEVKIENVKTTTTKQRVKNCLAYSEKLRKNIRPVLSYVCSDQLQDENGGYYQVFCDSWFLVALSDDDKLPIDDIKTTTYTYPNVKSIFNKSVLLSDRKISFVVSDLLNMFKLYENVVLKNNQYNVCLAKNNFKNFINFMNIKENEKIVLLLDNCFDNYYNRAIYVKHNNSIGLILPVRYDFDKLSDNVMRCE